MTTPAPGSYVIHPGRPAPTGQQLERICGWLRANGINPGRVPLTDPILVLTVPVIRGVQPPPDAPWRLQVIVFTEFYTTDDGRKEQNLLTQQPVTAQRTVPLTVPYPTTEEDTDGSTQEVQPVEEDQRPPQHQDGPEADELQELRPAETEKVQAGRSSSRQKCAGEGGAARLAGGEEAGPQSGCGQVPEPQEEAHGLPAPQEEVVEGGEGR